MPKDRAEFALLTKVLEDLDDFLPYLVLVGGWVPFIYSRYLWDIKHEPLGTVDIDFGFQNVTYKGKETIAARVRHKNYGEHHAALGHLHPFVPIVQLKKRGLSADVEFITAPETSKEIKKKLIGETIKVNTIEDFNILLQSPKQVKIGRNQVWIPNPAIFTFHKLLTFLARNKKDKREKDLYYAYYMLFFSPEKEKLTREVGDLIKTVRQGMRVRKNIEEHFEDPNDKGPFWIEATTKGSAIQTLIDKVRQDAFERIVRLIR